MSSIGEDRVVTNRRKSAEETVRLSLYANIRQGGADASSFLDALASAIEQQAWVKLGMGFREFIEQPFPHGIGSTLPVLDKLARLPHHHEQHSREKREQMAVMRGELRLLIDDEQPEDGQHGTNQHSGLDISSPPPSGQGGTSRAYRLARLKRDRADLAALVVSGELSTNAAWMEAGLDKQRGRPLVRLRNAWALANEEERAAFLAEIGTQ